MIEELRFVLEQEQTPERTNLLLGAVQILYEYDFTSFELELQNMISTDDIIGNDSLIMGIANVIETSVDVILRQLGLNLVGGMLPIKVAILDGMKTLETYDDHDSVIAAIDDEHQDSSQALASLLELVTDRTWADFAEVLGDVPDALVERLSQVHQREMEILEGQDPLIFDDEEIDCEEVDCEYLRGRLKDYIKKNDTGKQLLIEELVADGYRVGGDFTHYLNEAAEQVEAYAPKHPEDAARNILSLALASPLSISDIKQAVSDQLEDLYFDMSFITQVDIALTDEMRKVVAYG